MNRILLFQVSLLLLPGISSAQEMWGISNSNYAGNMGIYLNPSSPVGAPYRYEFNLIAGDFFAENTYLYFPAKEHIIPRALFGTVPDGKRYVDDYRERGQSAFGHVLLLGPSWLDNAGDHAWGIHLAFRSENSVLNLPYPLSKLLYKNFAYPPFFGKRFTTENFSAASLTFGELGGTYGKVLRESEHEYLKWGLNGNLLIGFDGMYLDGRQLDFTLSDTSLALIHAMDATLAYAVNANGNSSFFGIRGLGLGSSIGATFIRKRNSGGFECNRSNDNIKKYKYRIGLSLMDAGMVRFFRQSSVATLTTSTIKPWNDIDSIRVENMDQLDNLLHRNIGGATEDKGITMFLPMAIGLQMDYSITSKFYANLSWVNRVHVAPNEVARGNQAVMALRYETRRFEAALSYHLFEYRQQSLGLGLRWWFFVIGSDRLLQLIGVSDVKGADLFFGFKWQFCKKPFSPGPDCPAFQ